jgi:acyl dehydratase
MYKIAKTASLESSTERRHRMPTAKGPAEGRITDEGLAALQARVGIAQPNPAPPQYLSPGADTFRIVARSYGDDNPLWCDPGYAAESRWGQSIAPPPLVGGDSLIGEDVLTADDRAQQHLLKGDPLRGVHAFYSASEREWWAPLHAGGHVRRRNAQVAALDKASEFGGRAVHEWTANVFQDEADRLLAAQFKLMIRTERGEARQRRKYEALEPTIWTEAALAEIDAQYAMEGPRGANPRWFEDVDEGDVVGSMVKGPLTVTDMICWHTGMGMGAYQVAPLRLGWQNRKRIPRFYHQDELGIWDVMQRVHWDPDFARRSGNPTTFDYGRMRETWLIHLCTDWMGDDAWLWRLRVEFRQFNYVGDVQWLGGTVIRKYLAEGKRPAIDLELWARNQHDVLTTPGTATILLPSREQGPVRLPDPVGGATDLDGALRGAIDRFSRA